jgi:hypothetical protein
MASGSHGAQRRDVERLGGGVHAAVGKFGRMFPHLTKYCDASEVAMAQLAFAMEDVGAAAGRPDNLQIPAGFTYLGQFIDHDLTFDTTALSEVKVDPTAVFNFRTPRLELDSVYGSGPDGMPYLYKRQDNGFGPSLTLGTTSAVPKINEDFPAIPAVAGFDLPRLTFTPQGGGEGGCALIGDPRNDENLLVAQTHLAFLHFHNAVVDRLRGKVPDGALFEEARREVRWHYQWIVLHDFLPRLVDLNILHDVFRHGRKHFTVCRGSDPFMPVEFAGAAYRLGHSMIRQDYSHNRVFTEGGLTPATFDLLFQFTAKSGDIGKTEGLPGAPSDVLPANWIIDWRRFFRVDGARPAADNTAPADWSEPTLNFARPFDPYLATELARRLPFTDPDNPPPRNPMASLAFRNLMRGVRLQLPSGQAIARTIGITPLTPAQLTAPATSTAEEIAALTTHGFDRETPLWYYILKEAQLLGGALDDTHNGATLGPVGSVILAETFLGLLELDPDSFLVQEPKWSPTFGTVDMPDPRDMTRMVKRFTMEDMLGFVEASRPKTGPSFINPLG